MERSTVKWKTICKETERKQRPKRERWKCVQRTGGGRKEVGLARAMEREEQARSKTMGERERRRDAGRWKEWEGEREWRRETERRVRRLDLSSPGFCLCGSVELFLFWKNFPSFSLCLFLPLHSSLTQFFCPSQFISLQSSALSAFCLRFSFPLWLLSHSFSPCLNFFLHSHLSVLLSISHTFPSLSPPFFRWPPLSAFLLPSSSGTFLPGCISSRRASPKRYWWSGGGRWGGQWQSRLTGYVTLGRS